MKTNYPPKVARHTPRWLAKEARRCERIRHQRAVEYFRKGRPLWKGYEP